METINALLANIDALKNLDEPTKHMLTYKSLKIIQERGSSVNVALSQALNEEIHQSLHKLSMQEAANIISQIQSTY